MPNKTKRNPSETILRNAAAKYHALCGPPPLPTLASIIADPQSAEVPVDRELLRILANHLALCVRKHDLDPIMDYMARLPIEYQLLFVRTAVRHQVELIYTKRVGDWCSQNIKLLGLTHAITSAPCSHVP